MTRTNTYLRELPPGLTHIDVYWVLRLFNVTDPCVQHAVKKLLADGSGDKDRATNIREAWETLDRWVEMAREARGERMVTVDMAGSGVWIDESGQVQFPDDAPIEPHDAQRPPDRPLASHCADGGACKHKCGTDACKMADA